MRKEDNIVLGFVLCFLPLLMSFWIAYSYLEAKAFNSITNKNVTTWQAMFLELRIQENVEQKYNEGL